MRRLLLFLALLCLMPSAGATAQPNLLQELPAAKSVEVAGTHTCMVPRSGPSRCWGAETGYWYIPGGDSMLHSWEQDNTKLRDISQLSVSSSGNCALREGKVICWGSTQERPGSGVTEPTAFNSGLSNLVTGKQVECGVMGDLGDLFCWSGRSGEAVDPPDIFKNKGDGITDLATSQDGPTGLFDEWCAVAGRLVCWDNSAEAGGDNSQSPIHHIPADLGTVKSVSMSHSTICAVKKDGYIRCWGAVRTAPAGIKNPLQLRAGRTSCVITKEHQIHCWGKSLGIPHKILRRLGPISWLSDLNANHRCLVRYSGRIYCWGSDLYGQISGKPGSVVPASDRRLYLYSEWNYTPPSREEYRLGMYYDNIKETLFGWSRLSALASWTNYPRRVVEYWQSSRTGLGGWVTQKALPHTFDTPVGEFNIPPSLNNRYLRACSRAWNEHGSGLVCTRPFFWTKPPVHPSG